MALVSLWFNWRSSDVSRPQADPRSVRDLADGWCHAGVEPGLRDPRQNATASLDSAIDAIAVQIEEAIGADFTLGGIAKESVLTSTSIDFSGETEQPVGIATLTFSVRYVTSLTDVETAR